MANYLLIHGAWHGAWCWENIVPALQAQGHHVIAPDLPGHGQDKTPLTQITFDSYLAVMEKIMQQLQSVILVGHSFSGMIISALAERYPDKVKRLFYIAGYLPQNGQSMFDVASVQKPTRFVKMMRADVENNSFAFPFKAMKNFAYHQVDDSIFQKLEPLFCVEPYVPLVTPVALSEQHFGSVPRTYIECQEDKAILLDTQRKMLEAVPCEIHSLQCDHSPFYSMPEALIAILLRD